MKSAHSMKTAWFICLTIVVNAVSSAVIVRAGEPPRSLRSRSASSGGATCDQRRPRLLRLNRLISRRHSRAGDCSIACRKLDSPSTDSTAVAQTDWIRLFDEKSLDGWEVASFGGEGEVSVEDGRIIMDFGVMLTGITYKKEFPKSDYEIRYEAKRLDGIDFFGSLTFPVVESHCTFVAAGWAGAVVGLSNIDGFDASDNETTKFMNFDDDRWDQFRVRVDDDRIQAWIDDRQVIDQAIADHKFEIRPEVDLCKPLGIAAWQSRAALRNIEYRRLEDYCESQSRIASPAP